MLFVVEDEHYRRAWFMKAFNEQQIDFAIELDDVLEHLAMAKYDIVFLDHDLSDRTDGVQIARAIAEQKLQLGTPIIIHSDSEQGSAVMKSLLKDTHDVVTIPFYKLAGRRYWLHGDKSDVNDFDTAGADRV